VLLYLREEGECTFVTLLLPHFFPEPKVRTTNLFSIIPALLLALALGTQRLDDRGHFLYVANQNSATVSVIDMDTDELVHTVDLQALGFSPMAKPHDIAVEPDGSHWYVSLIAANTVLKFNRDHELVGRLEFERPGLMAIDPDSHWLYVGRSMAAVNPPQRIGVIDRRDMTIEEVDVFFPRPHAIAVGPGGDNIFTASLAVNQLATVDISEEAAELTTLGGTDPHVFVNFAISPDGGTMVGTAQLTSKVFFFDLANAPDLTPVDTLDVNSAPWHPSFTPDGRWLYVGNMEASTVTVIDVENRSVATVIEGNGIAQPHGSAVSPDGSKVYISNRNLRGEYEAQGELDGDAVPGTVVVIDVATQTISKIIEVGAYPAGIATNTVH
jgi:YVTN family beta-propeller protein